jgi:hypothetical protein
VLLYIDYFVYLESYTALATHRLGGTYSALFLISTTKMGLFEIPAYNTKTGTVSPQPRLHQDLITNTTLDARLPACSDRLRLLLPLRL